MSISQKLSQLHHDGHLTDEEYKEIRHIYFVIGETCVDESKGHISSKNAVEKIRKVLMGEI